MGRVQRILLVAVVLLIPISFALFGPQFVAAVVDETAWRRRTGPLTYLSQGRTVHLFEAQAELETIQRRIGLINSLRLPPRPVQTMRAAWSADERELLTTTGIQIHRWDSRSGQWRETLGAAKTIQAEDPRRWGFGFAEAVFVGPGPRISALTVNGPRVLWHFPGPASSRMVLEGDGYEQLVSRGGRIAMIKNLEYGLVIEGDSNRKFQLPHEEVTAIQFSGDNEIVTISRVAVKFWRGDGQLVRTVPIQGMDHPAGLSANGELIFVPAAESLEIWETKTGTKRFTVPHDNEWRGFCTSPEILATGSKSGQIRLWATGTGAHIRSFEAHADAIRSLFCATKQLLSVAGEGHDARLWDLSGAPNANRVPEPIVYGQNWFVVKAADLGLTERLPTLTEFLRDKEEDLEKLGFIGLIGWLLATFFAVKWAQARPVKS